MTNFNNYDLLEIIESFAADNGLISSEDELSDRFDQMIDECYPDIDTNDEVMISETFNNWSDSLCKDGDIHEEQYNNYCYVGKYS